VKIGLEMYVVCTPGRGHAAYSMLAQGAKKGLNGAYIISIRIACLIPISIPHLTFFRFDIFGLRKTFALRKVFRFNLI
jgi:hypothetical protein